MESVSQLVLTIDRVEGNPHLSPVVNGNGRLIKLFPAKLYCDIPKKFTWGVIKDLESNLLPLFLQVIKAGKVSNELYRCRETGKLKVLNILVVTALK